MEKVNRGIDDGDNNHNHSLFPSPSSKSFKWVLIITSLTDDVSLVQMVATTDDENYNSELDRLILKYRSQLTHKQLEFSTLTVYSSDYKIFSRRIFE